VSDKKQVSIHAFYKAEDDRYCVSFWNRIADEESDVSVSVWLSPRDMRILKQHVDAAITARVMKEHSDAQNA